MRRIGIAVILSLSLILAPLAAETQQAAEVAKIGLLLQATPAATLP